MTNRIAFTECVCNRFGRPRALSAQHDVDCLERISVLRERSRVLVVKRLAAFSLGTRSRKNGKRLSIAYRFNTKK